MEMNRNVQFDICQMRCLFWMLSDVVVRCACRAPRFPHVGAGMHTMQGSADKRMDFESHQRE